MKIINIVLACVIIILLLLGAWFYHIDKIKTEERWIRNLQALNDSVKVTQNKLGQEIFEKKSLESTLEELKYLNSTLYNEVKKMKGDVKYITQVTGVITDIDTLYSRDSIIIIKYDTVNTMIANWDFSDSTWIIKGGSVFDVKKNIANSYISERSIKFDLYTGIVEENGQKKIFVRSDNPNIIITDLHGAVLGKNKIPFHQRIFLGPSLGIGIDYKGKPNAMIGLSFGYNILPQKRR